MSRLHKRDRKHRRRLTVERLETRMLMAVDWRNPVDSIDVDNDGSPSPLDVLNVINDINANGVRSLPTVKPSSSPFFLDVDGDAAVSPLDVLTVINHLNSVGSGPRTMSSNGSFEVSRDVVVTVGTTDTGARIYRTALDIQFDARARNNLLPDLLSVYLLDPTQPGATLIDRGIDGTSLFSISASGKREMATGLVSWDGTTLEIDMSGVNVSETALLRFQLLVGSGSSNSTIVVRPQSNEIHVERVPGELIADKSRVLTPGGPLNIESLTSVSFIESSIYNARFGQGMEVFFGELELRNLGSDLGKVIAMVLPNLPSGVEIVNASGLDALGRPYINVSPSIRSVSLGAFEVTDRISLEISNPQNLPLVLVPEFFAGPANRSPVLKPIAPQSVKPGQSLVIPLEADDPDENPIEYSVRRAGGGEIPRGQIDSTAGRLTFSPNPTQIGQYTIEVIASDGVFESTQVFELNVLEDPITSTRISGQVLDVDGSPLPGLRVEIGAITGLTDIHGNFLIDLGPGAPVTETLRVRGDLYNPPRRYPFIAEKLPYMFGRSVYMGNNNVLSRPIYLPKLNEGEPINPSQNTTISQSVRADQPPVEVYVSAGSLLTQQGLPFVGNLSITEVPVNLTPAALPSNLLPDMVVTIQPGEMVFATPAPLSFPNTAGWTPQTPMDLWSINPVTGEFEIVGQMRVSDDGKTIDTISGGIRNSSWHFPAPPPRVPKPLNQIKRNKDDDCNECEAGSAATSEVKLHTGALIEKHRLVSYQSLGMVRGVELTYDSLRANPQHIVNFGFSGFSLTGSLMFASMTMLYRGGFQYSVPGYRPGLNSKEVVNAFDNHFWRSSFGESDLALQANMEQLPTGRYEYVLNLGTGNILPDQSRLDLLRFILTGSSSRIEGEFISVNSIESPFGAGWGISGLTELVENFDGSILLFDGDGSESIYERNQDGSYQTPPGDFSVLEKMQSGEYRRTFPNQEVHIYDSSGLLISIKDRSNNQTDYYYVPGTKLLQRIVDPVGLRTEFAYENGKLSSIVDPAGRITAMSYDSSGNLVRIVDPNGSYRTFQYDSHHRMIGEIDQNGASETVRYGFHGRVIGVTRKDGSTLNFDPVQVQGLRPFTETIDPFNPATAMVLGATQVQTVDGTGSSQRVLLDQAGQIESSNDAFGSFGGRVRDGRNLVTTQTDSRGYRTDFGYDANGNLVSVADEVIQSAVSSKSLFPGEKFPVGGFPLSVTSGDFNGDGRIDLVTANLGSNDVSVLLGLGNGSFTTPQRFAVGRFPFSVTSGDFNQDGQLDLVTANLIDNDVSILLGNGDGSFTNQQRFAAGGLPTSVAVGDLNGDGWLDLVTANDLSNDVAVLLSQGDGSFADPQRLAVGNGPSSVAVEDFNSDGSMDLVTANISSNDVSVLLGQGDGSFTSEQRFAVGSLPYFVSSGDFNGDGQLDLVTANAGSNDVSVLLGQGDGTFSAQQQFTVGESPYSAAVGDFNGDGRADLITANGFSSDVSLLLGRGDGSFASEQRLAVGELPYSVTAGDFNGDGSMDLATANQISEDVSVLLGQGDGSFTNWQRVEVGSNPYSVTVGDFNGDGQLDLVTANSSSNDISVLLGEVGGAFSDQQQFATGDSPFSIASGDFDGDGQLDLVTANMGSSDVCVFLGQGNGTFATPQWAAVGSSPHSVTVGDFNGDGLLDLVTANADSNDVSVLLGRGDGSFADGQGFSVGSNPYSVAVGDFNSDGRLDLVTANLGSNDVSVLLGEGGGSFSSQQRFAAGDFPTSIAVGDLNGDGSLDLITSSDERNNVSVLLGRGDGSFESEQRFEVGGGSYSITLGDFNGDARLDLVAAKPERHDVSVLLGQGDGSFTREQRFAVGNRPFSVMAGDFNSDGRLDLVTANLGSNDVSVLINQGGDEGSVLRPRRLVYDGTFSQLISSTDELGRQTMHEVDPANGNRVLTRRVMKQLDSLTNGETDDLITRMTYTISGLLDRVTDPQGRVTDYDYNTEGRLVTVTYALGTPSEAVIRYEYDLAGNRIAMVDENGNRTSMEYDSMNRVTKIIQPDPDGSGPLSSPTQQFQYDPRGNLIRTVDAKGSTTELVYDSLDRVVRTRDHLGKETLQAYDPNGNLISVTDPIGNTSRFQYDARNRVTHIVAPDGAVTKMQYDTENNVTLLVDPAGNQTRFSYDSRNRLVRETDPLGKEIRYIYDGVNNLVEKTDRNGRVTQFEYDDADRLISEVWIAADGEQIVNRLNYSYDGNGNLLSVVDFHSTIHYTYDSADRVQTVSNLGTPHLPLIVLTYAYDLAGNVTTVTDTLEGSIGASTQYRYDPLNRVSSIEQTGNGLSSKLVDLFYNAVGQYSEIRRYSDLNRSNFVAKTGYQFDALDRLVSLEHGTSLAAHDLAFYDYEYDAADRIAAITDVHGRTSYRYDKTDQLIETNRSGMDPRGNELYQYDANGNRSRSHLHSDRYQTGGANRLLSDGTYDYEYDLEGNMVRRTQIAGGTYRVFDYDHRNRLVRVTDYSAAGIATQQVDFIYDAINRRIAKIVDLDGVGPDQPSSEYFVYDGDHVILEFADSDGPSGDATPVLAVRNLFGPSIDMLLAQEHSNSGETYWILTDHLGTVREIVDESGVVKNRLIYDSFGKLISQSDPSIKSRYGFTGREWDDELNLHYYRARFLDQNVGVFTQADPIGFLGGDPNLYRYVSNDPMRYVDPTGNTEMKEEHDPGEGGGRTAIGGGGGSFSEVLGSTMMSNAIGDAMGALIEAALEGWEERREFEEWLKRKGEREARERINNEPCNFFNSSGGPFGFENGKPKFRKPNNQPSFRQDT